MNVAQSRRTPDDLFQALERRYGKFDLDAAADIENTRCDLFIDESMDALMGDRHWISSESDRLWCKSRTGELVLPTSPVLRVFCNPPWSNPAPWLEKAYTEAQRDPKALVVVVCRVTFAQRCAEWLDKALDYLPLIGRPQFDVPEGWYKCGFCGAHFDDHAMWPRKERVECAVCGVTSGTTKPLLNSSSDQDVAVLSYVHESVSTKSEHLPRLQFWRWKE